MTAWFLFPIALIAFLYASVGHGGASGYLAIMALANLAPEVMKPTALCLNLLASALALLAFSRAGHFRSALFWPFAIASIPLAFLGARLITDPSLFRLILAAVLLFSAVRLFLPARLNEKKEKQITAPSLPIALFAGAVMGFLSGMIGVGGGIFLTPLLLLAGWALPKNAAAVSAPFIFVNSAAGLIGHASSGGTFPSLWLTLAPGVLLGAFLGARWGAQIARSQQIRFALATVLLVATAKLLMAS